MSMEPFWMAVTETTLWRGNYLPRFFMRVGLPYHIPPFA